MRAMVHKMAAYALGRPLTFGDRAEVDRITAALRKRGDGLADLDIAASVEFHRSHGRLATVMAVQPPGRFGALLMAGEVVSGFVEKPRGDGGLINGGFFVLDPDCLDLIDGDATKWEEEPLRLLAERDQLRAFRHDGFWQPMDTLRDRTQLEVLWESGSPPWRVW